MTRCFLASVLGGQVQWPLSWPGYGRAWPCVSGHRSAWGHPLWGHRTLRRCPMPPDAPTWGHIAIACIGWRWTRKRPEPLISLGLPACIGLAWIGKWWWNTEPNPRPQSEPDSNALALRAWIRRFGHVETGRQCAVVSHAHFPYDARSSGFDSRLVCVASLWENLQDLAIRIQRLHRNGNGRA